MIGREIENRLNIFRTINDVDNKMGLFKKISFICIALSLIICFLIGFYDSPIPLENRETRININPEYTNGILTASGILFGMWIILLERDPGNRSMKAQWIYKHVIGETLFVNFVELSRTDIVFSFKRVIYCN